MSRRVSFLVAGLAIFVTGAGLSAQMPAIPQSIRREMRLRGLTTEVPPNRPPDEPAAQRIGTIATRIGRDRMEVRVYRHGQPIKLFPQFQELIAASPADHRTDLDQLAGKGVALVPSEKDADRWDIYIGVGGGAEFWLAENIFVVKQVLLSSRKDPIEVRVDGHIYRLKPGQALLVM